MWVYRMTEARIVRIDVLGRRILKIVDLGQLMDPQNRLRMDMKERCRLMSCSSMRGWSRMGRVFRLSFCVRILYLDFRREDHPYKMVLSGWDLILIIMSSISGSIVEKWTYPRWLACAWPEMAVICRWGNKVRTPNTRRRLNSISVQVLQITRCRGLTLYQC